MSAGGVIGKLAQQLKSGRRLQRLDRPQRCIVAETLAREDFDAVTLDMQHGGVDFVGAARAIHGRSRRRQADDRARRRRRFRHREPRSPTRAPRR